MGVGVLGIGCGAEPTEESDAPKEAQWMLEHAPDYLHDASWRRAELEASLWRPELPYARKRLAAYALEDGGWDLLPTIDARVEPVGQHQIGQHQIGQHQIGQHQIGQHQADQQAARDAAFDGRSIVPDKTPQTYEEWLALGKDVFWSMPMRRDAYLEWVVEQPELWDEVGLQTRDDGSLRGVVRFQDARGDVRLAATCGLCHGDQGTPGRASRTLDLGKGRDLFARASGADPRDFAQWGAGTVDVTDDGVTDSLAIPDLWGASHQNYLNSSGAVLVASPASLAVRFETQYIVGHSMEARPDRVLTWALAMYVLSLEAPSTPDEAVKASDAGREVFDQHCAICHRPDDGFSGDLVAAELLASDPQAAYSAFRGTGSYKVPSLIGVSDSAPYLHDASAPSLRALLDSGHPHRAELTDEQKTTLIHYLDTL
jgi:mono/diheme cytochrome c family protein